MIPLDNLVKTGVLHAEPANAAEFEGMLSAARIKLQDIQLVGLSIDSQFSLAYGAAHALSLAALRWQGYRTDKRYIVFQCLEHTLGLDNVACRILDKCHRVRNLAEYEGHLDIEAQLLKSLVEISQTLLTLVEKLAAIKE